jgi:hypothetical protein
LIAEEERARTERQAARLTLPQVAEMVVELDARTRERANGGI